MLDNYDFSFLMNNNFHITLQDESTTTLAGLLTTSGYSNDITKNGTATDGKAASRESRGEFCVKLV